MYYFPQYYVDRAYDPDSEYTVARLINSIREDESNVGVTDDEIISAVNVYRENEGTIPSGWTTNREKIQELAISKGMNWKVEISGVVGYSRLELLFATHAEALQCVQWTQVSPSIRSVTVSRYTKPTD